jgi:hypothetical protein
MPCDLSGGRIYSLAHRFEDISPEEIEQKCATNENVDDFLLSLKCYAEGFKRCFEEWSEERATCACGYKDGYKDGYKERVYDVDDSCCVCGR